MGMTGFLVTDSDFRPERPDPRATYALGRHIESRWRTVAGVARRTGVASATARAPPLILAAQGLAVNRVPTHRTSKSQWESNGNPYSHSKATQQCGRISGHGPRRGRPYGHAALLLCWHILMQ
jgi:hypothetical protein